MFWILLKGVTYKQKPWLTKGILKSFEIQNKMFKKQIKSSNPHLVEQYKIYRNKLTHLKESCKQNYFKSMFNKYNNNIKKWGWYNGVGLLHMSVI